MIDRTILAVAAVLLCASAAHAQDLDDDSCVYNRQVYPEGTQMCQSGTLERCEDGAWSDMGDCPDEPMPPPDSGGGDVDDEGDQ